MNQTLNTNYKIIFLFFLFYLFSIENNQVGFGQISNGQCSGWARCGGGNNYDGFPAGVAVDNDGNSYFTGQYFDQAIFGSDTLTSDTSGALFLNKYDESGNMIWLKNIVSGANFYGFKNIIYDGSNGTLFIFGGTNSFLKFSDGTSINDGAYLIKLDTSGAIIWKKAWGADFASYVSAAVPDGAGGVYVCGRFSGTVDFGGTVLNTSYSNYKTFIARYDINGNLLWAIQASETGNIRINRGGAISLSPGGQLIVTGYYTDSLQFGTQMLLESNSNTTNKPKCWIGAFDQNGACLWLKGETTITTIALSPIDACYGIVLDSLNQIYIDGVISDSIDFFGVAISGGRGSAFISKLDASGNFLWLQKYSSLSTTGSAGAATDIHISSDGKIITTGFLRDTCAFNGDPLPILQNEDFFASIFDSGGNLIDEITTGGRLFERTYQSCLDNNNNLYLAGYFSSDTLSLFNSNSVFRHGNPADSSTDGVIWKLCYQTINGIEATSKNEFNCPLFPNPANGDMHVSCSVFHANATLEIFNTLGEKTWSAVYQEGLTVNCKVFPPGIYFVRLSDSEKQLTQKLVVE